MADTHSAAPGRINWINPLEIWRNEFGRQVIYQVVMVLAVITGVWYLAGNVSENLEALGVPLGFDFLSEVASYDINQTLISYTSESSHGRAALVGIANTVVLALVGIVLASIIGLFVGIARLSRNLLLAKLALAYVEIMRNIPLLIHILLWQGIFFALPSVRQSFEPLPHVLLSSRGLIVPAPVFQTGIQFVLIALLIACVLSFLWSRRSQKIQRDTGRYIPVFWPIAGILLGTLFGSGLIVTLVSGASPVTLDFPELQRFNYSGGAVIRTEFIVMLVSLSVYTGAFIAEVVRAGIISVAKGQREASSALGLSSSQSLRLVILPQALRVIIPPMTNQYLNLTKNSSLGIAIGYADITATLGGITLNQTGRALECVGLLLLFYLTFSLLTSLFMNWFNYKTQIISR